MKRRIASLALLLLFAAFSRTILAQELYVEPLKKAPVAKSPLTTLRLSPVGDLLAVAGTDKAVLVIEPTAFKLKLALTARSPRLQGIAFSRDGKYLVAAGTDGLLTQWTLSDGMLVREITAHGKGLGVSSVDIAPSGAIVSCGGDGDVKVWSVNSDELYGTFPKGSDESEALCVAFDPAGTHVAAAYSDGSIRIFDPQTYLLVRTLSDLKVRVNVIAFSPNGKYLASASADSTIRIWDMQSFSLLQTMRGKSAAINSLAFNPNNVWLIATYGAISIWDVSSGTLRKTISDSSSVFTTAAFLSDSSSLVAATTSGVVASFMVLTRKPDKEPPLVVIQKPVSKEGEVYKLYASDIEISGIASDESGVKEVKVAGLPAKLTDPTEDEKKLAHVKEPSKKFSGIAPLLTVGTNDIPISAMDERGNVAVKDVRVQRLGKEAALEILNPKENDETDQSSINLDFKTWFDYTRYSITLNTVEVVNKEDIPRKPLGILQSETLPLSSGFNQIQFTVSGKGGEKISKVINVTRHVLTSAASQQSDNPQRALSSAPQQWAVVIGISEYQNPTIKNLSYADRDARDFADFLKSPAGGGFDPQRMKVLLNKDATLQNVKQALYNFLRQTIDKDLVVIYFAGHGSPEPANPNNNYLLTYDTDPTSLETTAFPMWDVNTALTRYIPSKRVIVFSDACHSGGISSDLATRGVSLTETNLINQYLSDLSKSKEGTIVFTASQAGEVSQELDKFGHGVFTYFLLKGMKGEADINNDYTVTIGELMDYVEQNVERQTKGNQHPTRNQGNYDKDLTISLIPH